MPQEALAILIVVLIAGVAIAAAIVAHIQAKKRREALAALAKKLGWDFYPGRDSSHDDQYAHFEIFRKGHSRVAFNTLVGSVRIDGRDFPARMGDFQYKITRRNGKSSSTTTYRFSYLILHLPFPRVPDLLIRPEGFFDKLAGVVGFDDIDFESAEFSKRFCVKSNDKRFAYDVCHPRMMEFLLASGKPSVDIENGRCCISDGRSRWTPEGFTGQLGWIARFFDNWPDHLTSDLDSRRLA